MPRSSARYATELKACGVERINVSLDTLDADKFRDITRWGELDKVLAGIDAALAAGLKVKINTVALKGVNEDEIAEHARLGARPRHGYDGDRGDAAGRHRGRAHRPIPAAVDGARAARRTLSRWKTSTTAPAVRRATCASRKPAAGSASSRRSPIISASPATGCASPAPARCSCAWARTMPPTCARPCAPRKATTCCYAAIDEAIARKPKGHDFVIDRRHQRPALARHMSVTGG